jgi:hypothetical protein
VRSRPEGEEEKMRHAGIGTLVCVLVLQWCLVGPVGASESRAYRHLDKVMDRFHRTFDVYTDISAPGNHFAVRAILARRVTDPADLSAVSMREDVHLNPRSGATCIEATFDAIDSTYWGGFVFGVGTMEARPQNAEPAKPEMNFGTLPNAGYDLAGARKITFWARGARGGERIEFFAGGTGWNVEKRERESAYPDSFCRIPSQGKTTTLTRAWKKYSIDLGILKKRKNENLRHVIGGFAWVASAKRNPDGAVFYIDDIRYHRSHKKDLHLLRSYEVLPDDLGWNFDTTHTNTAYTYDNVVVLLAYLARGKPKDLRRAEMLADALVYAQENDRYYTDGRIRNAYQAGDLVLPPAWRTLNQDGVEDTGRVRLPGWWEPTADTDGAWNEVGDQVGTSTGNMAYAMLGLLQAYEQLGKNEYLDAACRMADWIEANTRHSILGYTGGFVGHEPAPARQLWRSTEHSLDIFVAFTRLAEHMAEPAASTWRSRANHARAFVESMWGACDSGSDVMFATGTGDGDTPNCAFKPADVNTWGVMVLGAGYAAGVEWVMSALATENATCGFPGAQAYGTPFGSESLGHIWWEGTAHTAIAEQILGHRASSKRLLENLKLAQKKAPNGNGKGIVAVCVDGVPTGIEGFEFYNRLHIAATAWYALARRGYNPYWGTKIKKSRD